MHNFYDKSKCLVTRYFITPRIDRTLLRSCVGPVQMQVNITQVEHFKTPSCTRFSHSSLTLPWPSLRRNRGLLVPSTGHLSLVHASWEYEMMTCTLTASQKCQIIFIRNRKIPKIYNLTSPKRFTQKKTRNSSCANEMSCQILLSAKYVIYVISPSVLILAPRDC